MTATPDSGHIRSALETLSDPLLIKVDGVGTARLLALEMRNAVIEECAHAAFAAYGSLTSAQYAMEGPAGLAKRMIGAVKALALPSTNHSPPAGCGSLPSGESDPAVTQDYAGGDAIPSPNREGVSDLERILDRLSTRLNDALCEMKPSHDDSICGFNEAWDIMRKLFKEEMDRKAKP